jgi:hypothetical protein
MQLVKVILTKVRQGNTPEDIARIFSPQSMVLTKEDEKDILNQSQQAIDYAPELGESREAWTYLRALFLIFSRRDEWITLRVLGKIIESPSFHAQEKYSALTTMLKRLDRITIPSNGKAKVDKLEFLAYYHCLKAGLDESQKKYGEACNNFQEAFRIYGSIGLPQNQAWAQDQLSRVVALMRPENQPMGETVHDVNGLPEEQPPIRHDDGSAAVQTELVRVQSELDEERLKNSSLAEQINLLARERDERVMDIRSLNARIAGLSNQVAQLTQQQKEQGGTIAKLSQDLSERNQQISTLQQELAKAPSVQLEEKPARNNRSQVKELKGDVPEFWM